MGHSHNHQRSTDNLRIVFFLNLCFTIVEVIGGWYTNSVAIYSDALHDFGDTFALGLAWYFQHLSTKQRDKYYSYGYGRFSLLGSLITSVVLVIGAVFILQESIPRFFDPVQPKITPMIWLAVIGVIVNGAAVFRLNGSKSLSERAVMLHLLEDVLGWIIVLIGAIVMMFYDLPFIDPLLSTFLAAFILFNVFRNLKAAFKVIMQAIPDGIHLEEIEKYLIGLPEVKKVKDLHVWSTDGEYYIMTASLIITKIGQSRVNGFLEELRNHFREQGIEHITVETEVEEQ